MTDPTAPATPTAAQRAWETFKFAYIEWQRCNPGWRAFWTDHHAYALNEALHAYGPPAPAPAVDALLSSGHVTRARIAGVEQASRSDIGVAIGMAGRAGAYTYKEIGEYLLTKFDIRPKGADHAG